jgi:hypothetical protein
VIDNILRSTQSWSDVLTLSRIARIGLAQVSKKEVEIASHRADVVHTHATRANQLFKGRHAYLIVDSKIVKAFKP